MKRRGSWSGICCLSRSGAGTSEAVRGHPTVPVWLVAWRTLLGALDGEGLLKWEETLLDGSFAPAKRGALPRLPLDYTAEVFMKHALTMTLTTTAI